MQVIFCALFIGLAITFVDEKAQPVYQLFEGFAEIMCKINGIVMKFALIRILGLLAPVVGQYGRAVLLPLDKVIIAVFIA